MNSEESTPHRARRLGKEYAETYHDRWSNEGRKWIRFAFAKGYQMSCKDQAEEAQAIDDAILALDNGEMTEDDFFEQYLNPWLEKIDQRAA